jgi:transposase
MPEGSGVITLESVFMIHELRAQGVSISAIARQLGLDRKTVRRHIEAGVHPPAYGPRPPRGSIIDPYREYLRARVEAYPGLSARRLLREIQAQGYTGGYTRVTDCLRELRPPTEAGFVHRFETPAGHQAQVDFAQFKVNFRCEPQTTRVVWLFSMVLGFSRYLFGRFVWRQTLDMVVRCHIEAFTEFGGVPRQVLYDRMKTAVLGEPAPGNIVYNPTLVSMAAHYGYQPKACRPYRAQTKGKVERPYRYVRQDFFLAGEFEDLEDLNGQFDRWRTEIAHPRVHGTTGRVIAEAFEEDRQALQPLPAGDFNEMLSLERRVTHEGMVSVDGNLYSVPDTTRERCVEVQRSATEVHIFEQGRLIAVHPVLTGRGQRRVANGHRRQSSKCPAGSATQHNPLITHPGSVVAQRPLAEYQRIGQAMARGMST